MEYIRQHLENEAARTMAESMSDSSKATGIVTPYSLMVTLAREVSDMRKQNEELLRQNTVVISMMEQQNEQMKAMLEVMKRQSEMMDMQLQASAATLRVTERPNVISVPMRQSSVAPPNSMSLKDRYVEGEKVSNGAGLVTAVLYQLVHIVHNEYIRKHHPDITNENSIGYKDMRAVIDGLVKASSRASNVINMPKPSDAASKEALGYITSDSPSIPTQCNMEHIMSMCSQCNSVMATVEKVREILVKCDGIIGPVQQSCLSIIKYPYVENGSLVIDDNVLFKNVLARMRIRNDVVRKFKATNRNAYAELVLSGTPVYLAIKDCTSDNF